MTDDSGGARKGGNNSLQRWQIAAAAVGGISGVALCFILPREIIRFILIGGMILFAGVFLIGGILIEFSAAHRARGGKAKKRKEGSDAGEK